MVDGFLFCEECGCASGELGRGWVAYQYDDLDVQEPPTILVHYPPCAAREFDTGPDAADGYV